MRPRELDRLSAAAYDVLVVGGGIHGLVAPRSTDTTTSSCLAPAAAGGVRVARIDVDDLAGRIDQ